MACDCKWSEAIEKRLAHLEHHEAMRAAATTVTPYAQPRNTQAWLAVRPPPPVPVLRDEPVADPAIREVLRASYAAARSAEVRGYAIDTAQFLLSDLHAAGFKIVRTDRAA